MSHKLTVRTPGKEEQKGGGTGTQEVVRQRKEEGTSLIIRVVSSDEGPSITRGLFDNNDANTVNFSHDVDFLRVVDVNEIEVTHVERMDVFIYLHIYFTSVSISLNLYLV